MVRSARGAAGHAVAVRSAACLLLVFAVPGCNTTNVTVVPIDVILVSNGGANLPSEFTTLVVSCEQDLRQGRHAECRDEAERAQESADPQVRAAALVLERVADTNLGDHEASLADPNDVEVALDQLPDNVQNNFAEIYFRAQAVSAAATGDEEAAAGAARRVDAVSPERSELVRTELCRAAADPQGIDECRRDPPPPPPPPPPPVEPPPVEPPPVEPPPVEPPPVEPPPVEPPPVEPPPVEPPPVEPPPVEPPPVEPPPVEPPPDQGDGGG
ncbi:hypothetical protein [Pseudonocardia cypriaca]|uniref:hypothetical protein n=1 Tax=Pseudonocardia cypriaca TaxID=882449 RepID=UPI001154C3A0|nr:hypothetical protein [Pseudonocardia cypriaca]